MFGKRKSNVRKKVTPAVSSFQTPNSFSQRVVAWPALKDAKGGVNRTSALSMAGGTTGGNNERGRYCSSSSTQNAVFLNGNGVGAPMVVTEENVFQRPSPSGQISQLKPNDVATILSPRNYKIRPIIPAKEKKLIPVAKAMHRETFKPHLRNLFQLETDAALEAIESGIYIGWRCPEYSWDCIRLSQDSRCFCDHPLREHASYNGKSVHVKCLHPHCSCKAFSFIPQRPEDIGEWWLPKRPGFDRNLWRAKCRCKHTNDCHDPSTKRCTVRQCSCYQFTSNFLCAACDRHWEEHETFFDSLQSRKTKGLPHGNEYLPFHEMPDLRQICLSQHSKSSTIQPNMRIQNAAHKSLQS